MPDFLTLYKNHVPKLKKERGNQWRGNCPFHDELSKENKSFCVDMQNGQHKCHSCGESGNAIKFARAFDEDETKFYDNQYFQNHKLVSNQSVEKFHDRLMTEAKQIPSIWDKDVLNHLKVGWHLQYQTFTFPIFNEAHEIINLKVHKEHQTTGSKISLYPAHLISKYNSDSIIVCEGEKDVISLLSFGIQAVTSTGGAVNIPKDISSLKKFEKIYLCFDNDETGDNGIDTWIYALKILNKNCYIRACDFSQYVDIKGDVTDYFLLENKNRDSFTNEIIAKSRFAPIPGSDVPDYFRSKVKSDLFVSLSERDKILFTTIISRACRYRVTTSKINGMNVRMRPGQLVISMPRLAKLCGKGWTAKKVQGGLRSLQKLKILMYKDLKMNRGVIITLLDWARENGRTESHTENDKMGIQDLPIFSIRDGSNEV